jgi:histone-lysine N-methyltransferase SETMAR
MTFLTSKFWLAGRTAFASGFFDYPNPVSFPVSDLESLTGVSWYEIFYLHWIPHELTTNLRQIRVETCRELLPTLIAHEKNKFQRFVTGDENWFTLEFHHSTKWSLSRDDVPQKVKQQIRTPKFMLTLVWGIDGFHVVGLMTEQHSYNTQSFLSYILEPLLFTVFPDGRKPHSHRLSLHFDNCRVHRSKAPQNFFAENSMMRISHPLYSPDLAPSDFWIFGHMKAALARAKFPGPEDLLIGIQEFLSEFRGLN